MSYCRWSTDDFQCDLYCYEDVHGGWTTHVAGLRRERRTLAPSPYTLEAIEAAKSDSGAWAKIYRAYHDELASIPLEPIGLPHDGQSFNDPTLEDFRARLIMLREAGYQFPDYVLEDVDAEIAEGTA